MAFQQIDDTAITEDRPLDVAVCQNVVRNGQQSRSDRLRACTATFNFEKLPRISALYDMCMPFVWPLTPGVTQVKLTLRHTTPSNVTSGGTEMFVTATARGMSQYDGGGVPDGLAWEVNLAQSLTVTTTEININTTRITDKEIIIFLHFRSGEGSVFEVQPADGSGAETTFRGIRRNGALFLTNDTFSAVDCTPTKAIYLAGTTTLHLPAFGLPSQILQVRQSTSGGADYKAVVWPPFENSTIPANAIFERYGNFALHAPGHVDNEIGWMAYELGYIDLYSVEIRETTLTTQEQTTQLYNARKEPSSLIGLGLYQSSANILFQQTRVHSIGPHPDISHLGQVFTTEPVDRIGHAVNNYDSGGDPFLNEDYQTIAMAVVGGEHQYKMPSSATTKRRTRITMAGLFHLHHYEDLSGSNGEVKYKVDTRIMLSDADTTSNQKASEEHPYEGYSQYTVPTGDFRNNDKLNDFAYLAGLSDDSVQVEATTELQATHRRANHLFLTPHTLKGLWPVNGWETKPGHAPNCVPFRVTVTDNFGDPDNGSAEFRIASLQVKVHGVSTDGIIPVNRRYVTLVACSVWTTVGIAPDENEPGVEEP